MTANEVEREIEEILHQLRVLCHLDTPNIEINAHEKLIEDVAEKQALTAIMAVVENKYHDGVSAGMEAMSSLHDDMISKQEAYEKSTMTAYKFGKMTGQEYTELSQALRTALLGKEPKDGK